MLKSKIIDKNNYLQEVEISKENFKIDGHEIRGITKYKINYSSDSKVVSIDLSIDVKSVTKTKKLNTICTNCWIKHRSYDCDYNTCPGYKLLILESNFQK